MHAALRVGSAAAVGSGVIRLLERLAHGDERRVAVLTYHRVDDPAARPHLYPGLISATPDAFEQQVRLIAERWNAVTMAELLAAKHGARLPRRPLLITFDDAYQDLASNAWPILRRHDVPATLFVPTDFPSDRQRSFWWDRLWATLHAAVPTASAPTPVGMVPLRTTNEAALAFRRLRTWVKRTQHVEAMAALERLDAQLPPRVAPPSSVLTWEVLRGLVADGLSVASHGRSHALLDRVDGEMLENELRGSAATLRLQIPSALPAFAYPSGQHDPRTLGAAAEAGYDVAFTTVRGLIDMEHDDPMRLPRVNIGATTTTSVMRAELVGLGLLARTTPRRRAY